MSIQSNYWSIKNYKMRIALGTKKLKLEKVVKICDGLKMPFSLYEAYKLPCVWVSPLYIWWHNNIASTALHLHQNAILGVSKVKKKKVSDISALGVKLSFS